MKSIQIAIIGGGPAGIAAGVQLKRYGLAPYIFEANQLGGLLNNAWRVENYPGFPEGIHGLDLARYMEKHCRVFEVDIVDEMVMSLEYEDERHEFNIKTVSDSYTARYVVAASGTRSQKLEFIESLSSECREKTLYEVYPLAAVGNKRIAIIGAGDAAFDYAMNLTPRNEVIILNRTNQISALSRLQELVDKNRAITYCENIRLLQAGLNHIGKLTLSLAKFQETWQLEVDYLIAAIGREPNKEYYSDKLLKKETDLIKKGLMYLAGDVKNGRFRQTAISVGDGVRAAMEIYDRVKTEKR